MLIFVDEMAEKSAPSRFAWTIQARAPEGHRSGGHPRRTLRFRPGDDT